MQLDKINTLDSMFESNAMFVIHKECMCVLALQVLAL